MIRFDSESINGPGRTIKAVVVPPSSLKTAIIPSLPTHTTTSWQCEHHQKHGITGFFTSIQTRTSLSCRNLLCRTIWQTLPLAGHVNAASHQIRRTAGEHGRLRRTMSSIQQTDKGLTTTLAVTIHLRFSSVLYPHRTSEIGVTSSRPSNVLLWHRKIDHPLERKRAATARTWWMMTIAALVVQPTTTKPTPRLREMSVPLSGLMVPPH